MNPVALAMTLELIAKTGQPSPLVDHVYQQFHPPQISQSGAIGFASTVIKDGTQQQVLLARPSTTFEVVARAGQALPGAPPNETFAFIDGTGARDFRFYDTERFAFWGLTTFGDGSSRQTLWTRSASGNPENIWQNGQSAYSPVTGAFHEGILAVAAAPGKNELVLAQTIVGPLVQSTNDHLAGIWNGSGWTPLFREGVPISDSMGQNPVPSDFAAPLQLCGSGAIISTTTGLAGNKLQDLLLPLAFKGSKSPAFPGVTVSDFGPFAGSTTGKCLWIHNGTEASGQAVPWTLFGGTPDAPELLAQKNQAVPALGPGAWVQTIDALSLQGNRMTARIIDGNSVPHLLEGPIDWNQLSLVTAVNVQVPEANPGVLFTSVSVAAHFADGKTVVRGQSGSNVDGLYVYHQGVSKKIIQTGDTYEGAKVSSIALADDALAPVAGGPSIASPDAKLVFLVTLDDNNSAIVQANLTNP